MSGDTIRVLALSGSTRTESLNKRLLAAVAGLTEEAGAEVDVIELRDYPLPLYDGDLEDAEGIPENGTKLKRRFVECDAVLISTAEYNTSLPGVLKNAIDWISRPVEGEPRLAGIAGQVYGIMSASPGSMGGLNALLHLRQLLSNLGAYVVPGFTACPNAASAFDEAGNLQHDMQRQLFAGYVKQVVELARFRSAD